LKTSLKKTSQKTIEYRSLNKRKIVKMKIGIQMKTHKLLLRKPLAEEVKVANWLLENNLTFH